MTGDKQRRLDEELCNELCNTMSVALIVIACHSEEILYVNQKVCVDLGMSRAALVGNSYKKSFLPEFHQVYEELARACQDGAEHTATYYWAEKVLWEQISAKLMFWHDKDRPGDKAQKAVLLTITNITEVARKQYEYERAVYFDTVTELPNAKKLSLDLKEMGSNEEIFFIYLQMENFDDIVDLYGWDATDQLRLLTRDWLIESEFNRAQFYKGERGFILLGRGVSREDIVRRIESIIKRFEQPWTIQVDDTPILVYCKIRIGGVAGDYVRSDIRTILLRTIQMSTPPTVGYTIYDKKEDTRLKAVHKLRIELIHAIHNNMNGFSVVYQPIVDTKTAQWVGLEALCRWIAPSGRQVPPSEFIPALEKLGFVAHVDNWVRREAMRQCVELGLNEKQIYLDVNFSPVQAIDDSYISDLFKDLKETGFPVNCLILEITEGEQMRFDEVTLGGLAVLRKAGVMLSLDDFGTGYSTLENLLKLEATTLKIDKMLVDEVEMKEEQQYLIGVLIDLAHHLNMSTIVEGVETKRQHDLLLDYGAELIQGYYFSKPLTALELAHESWRFER